MPRRGAAPPLKALRNVTAHLCSLVDGEEWRRAEFAPFPREGSQPRLLSQASGIPPSSGSAWHTPVMRRSLPPATADLRQIFHAPDRASLRDAPTPPPQLRQMAGTFRLRRSIPPQRYLRRCPRARGVWRRRHRCRRRTTTNGSPRSRSTRTPEWSAPPAHERTTDGSHRWHSPSTTITTTRSGLDSRLDVVKLASARRHSGETSSERDRIDATRLRLDSCVRATDTSDLYAGGAR